MKKIALQIKTTAVILTSLFVALTGFSQKSNDGFGGWNISLNAGAGRNASDVHWNSPIQIARVTGLTVPGLGICIVPGDIISIPDTSMHNSGVSANFQIGYAKVFNHVLVGAGVGLGYNPFTASQTTTYYPGSILQAQNPLTIQREVSTQWTKSVNAKMGYVKEKHLIYATFGISFKSMKVTSTDDYQLSPQLNRLPSQLTDIPYTYTSINDTQEEVQKLTGFTWGIGYQYQVSDGVRLGIEYSHTGFGNKTYTTSAVTGDAPVKTGDATPRRMGTQTFGAGGTGATGSALEMGGAIGESTMNVNLKQSAFMVRVEVALSSLFKHK